jgi:flagellar basal-body rod protein FlgC
MPTRGLTGALSTSASGMAAERLRMEVIANNIANAQSTRGPKGEAFRRQDVILATVGGPVEAHHGHAGVRVAEVVDDQSPFERVYMPGHPDADGDGYVAFPNVHVPVEMVNLLTAMRSYEANLKAAQATKQMSEQALTLIKGS